VKPVQSFGVVAFKKNQQIVNALEQVQRWSAARGIPAVFHPRLHDQLPAGGRLAGSEQELIDRAEALISIGGDGTFLAVAHLSRFSEKPVIGINLGGLGFLTDIGPENIDDNLERISRGDYTIISRMIIKGALIRKGKRIREFDALNDIFVNRYNLPKLTSIQAWYGDDYISDFQADGIIVATPSGSTAYSLAAGGPIVEPSLRAFLMTPICPHSLTERPIVLPAEQPIRLVINQKNPDLLLSADGIQAVKLHSGDEILITYEGAQTCLIQLTERSYFELLRSKLSWGQDYKRWRNRPA
jgi:NAD+ kinase